MNPVDLKSRLPSLLSIFSDGEKPSGIKRVGVNVRATCPASCLEAQRVNKLNLDLSPDVSTDGQRSEANWTLSVLLVSFSCDMVKVDSSAGDFPRIAMIEDA